MSLFTYEIAAPTNVVEASASPEPDDVSKAYIRIEATPTRDIAEGEISEIRFEINVLSNPNESVDDKNRELLTRNPGNITPVAKAFKRWTFSAPGEKNIFVARPDAVPDETGDQILVKAGEVLVFYLYDIEVIDRDGETKIKVTEVDGEEKEIPDTIPDLVIRKIFPALRIDFFTADKLAVKAGTQVQLEWATTSATKILLSGITDTDIALSDNPTALKDPSLDGFQILETNLPGQQVAQKDGNFFVRPETTTTYTLQARSDNADTVALQQLTITVTDQIKAKTVDAENVKFHNGNLFVTGGAENLQIVQGFGSDDKSGKGYKLQQSIEFSRETQQEAFNWTITFDTPFSSAPFVIASDQFPFITLGASNVTLIEHRKERVVLQTSGRFVSFIFIGPV